jgi:hypothetical protein
LLKTLLAHAFGLSATAILKLALVKGNARGMPRIALNDVAAARSMLPEIAPAKNRISAIEWFVVPIPRIQMPIHLPTVQLRRSRSDRSSVKTVSKPGL